MKPYKQLTYEQRCQIYALKKTGLSQEYIAKVIGTNQSTVSRELKRNRSLRGYRYQQAQRLSDNRRKVASKAIKMTVDMIQCVESKLCKKWSPEQISGWLDKGNHIALSHEIIYRYVWKDKAAQGHLYRHLRRQSKAYQRRSQSQAGRGHIKNRISIHDRPAIVDEKTRTYLMNPILAQKDRLYEDIHRGSTTCGRPIK